MKMAYDSKGQMLSMQDGLGNVIQAFTYYANGLTKTETDTSGTSQYFYDNLENLTKSIDPDGSITTMSYDFNGKLKRMVEDKETPNDITDDEVSVFDYDKLGREKLADYGDGICVKYDYEGAGGDWLKLEALTIAAVSPVKSMQKAESPINTFDRPTPDFPTKHVNHRSTQTGGARSPSNFALPKFGVPGLARSRVDGSTISLWKMLEVRSPLETFVNC